VALGLGPWGPAARPRRRARLARRVPGHDHRLRSDTATAQAWLSEWDASFAGLAALYGEEFVAERQRKRRAQLRAIGDGLLARSLFTATRP
jgi:hypothetical protein